MTSRNFGQFMTPPQILTHFSTNTLVQNHNILEPLPAESRDIIYGLPLNTSNPKYFALVKTLKFQGFLLLSLNPLGLPYISYWQHFMSKKYVK